ncbi:MAG: hypothetical protein PUC44_07815, partial [Eubacteriales bacterium]|nr:hypothetical protein [Eubacteriales bacterium]
MDKKIKKAAAELAAEEPTVGAAVKTAAVIVGVGLVAGVTLVLGMNQIMKSIFVHEEWPEEEWSSDDWAEEDLD